jgi:preprotein translocase subunit SecF
MSLKEFYFKNLKKLIFIPIILIILSLFIVSNLYFKTGDFVYKDVTLQGGISATLQTTKEFPNLEKQIEQQTNKDVIIRQSTQFGTNKQVGLIIESSDLTNDELKPILESITNIKITNENYSIEETGSTLGQAFYKQMISAILIAFILMSIVVFAIYRALIPSIAVILAAFADMIVTIAVVDLIGLRISTAGIAAILLLMGYSIDTDVLLTTRMIKRREESVENRILNSIKTGLTMTFTTIAALTAGYFITNSFVIKEMFLILIIGLMIDVIMTYLLNTNLLLKHVRKKEYG